MIDLNRLNATAIGEIHPGRDVTCMNQGKVLSVNQTGYQHFDADNA